MHPSRPTVVVDLPSPLRCLFLVYLHRLSFFVWSRARFETTDRARARHTHHGSAPPALPTARAAAVSFARMPDASSPRKSPSVVERDAVRLPYLAACGVISTITRSYAWRSSSRRREKRSRALFMSQRRCPSAAASGGAEEEGVAGGGGSRPSSACAAPASKSRQKVASASASTLAQYLGATKRRIGGHRFLSIGGPADGV